MQWTDLSDEKFAELEHVITTGSSDARIKSLYVLGHICDRRTLPILMRALKDEQMAPYVVNSLGTLEDTRALFPLVNTFNLTDSAVLKQRILQYMAVAGDPRATDFLQDYLTHDQVPFKDIASSALARSTQESPFEYNFSGKDEDLTFYKDTKGQIKMSNHNLTAAEERIKENSDFNRPQTYVVLEDQTLLVGGTINEHVAVAGGNDVLAAGELVLEKEDSGLWRVTYVNNRSNGYYPASQSFSQVKAAMGKTDVSLSGKTEFDGVYPSNGFNDPEFLSLFQFGENYLER
jgi:HEAT repeat protein